MSVPSVKMSDWSEVLPDTRAVQLCTRLTSATSSWGETMKQTRPRRMRERPERRVMGWREASGEESEDRTDLEGRNRPGEDRSDIVNCCCGKL